MTYLSTEISSDGANPREVLQAVLHRLHADPLYEAYYTEHVHEQSASAEAGKHAHVHVLDGYQGAGTLTEGLDWEAEQGRKAWEAVMRGDEAEEGAGWWEGMGEEEEEGEAMI